MSFAVGLKTVLTLGPRSESLPNFRSRLILGLLGGQSQTDHLCSQAKLKRSPSCEGAISSEEY